MRYRYPIACPTCGEGPYLPCRTTTGTGRTTDTHQARWMASFPAERESAEDFSSPVGASVGGL